MNSKKNKEEERQTTSHPPLLKLPAPSHRIRHLGYHNKIIAGLSQSGAWHPPDMRYR